MVSAHNDGDAGIDRFCDGRHFLGRGAVGRKKGTDSDQICTGFSNDAFNVLVAVAEMPVLVKKGKWRTIGLSVKRHEVSHLVREG